MLKYLQKKVEGKKVKIFEFVLYFELFYVNF